MSLKEVIKFERENLTPEHLKFNRTILIPLIILFTCAPTVVVVISVLLGLKFGGSIITLIPIFVWAVFMAVYVILFAVNIKKVNNSIIATRAAELEEKFADMPLEEAEQILKDNKVINDKGFIYFNKDEDSDNCFSEFVIPFENADISIFCSVRSTVIEVTAYLCDDREDDKDIFLKLDRALFNFLDKRNLIVDEDEFDFAYLKNDKKNFCRRALGIKIK